MNSFRAELELKRKAASGVRLRPFLMSISSLSSWAYNYATIFKEKSPLFMWCLAFLRVLGGLTREFWAVFAKNSSPRCSS
jgi:hypothetical protein